MNHYAICIKDNISGFTLNKIYEIRFDNFTELFNDRINPNYLFEQLGGCYLVNDNGIKIHLRVDFDTLYNSFRFVFNSEISEADKIEENNMKEKSGNIKLRIPKFLHASLIKASEKEGVSLNQLCLMYLSIGIGKEETNKINLGKGVIR